MGTAFTQSLGSDVEIGHDDFPHLERGLMEADIHPDDHHVHHQHNSTQFIAEDQVQVADVHTSFFDSPSPSLAAEHVSQHASPHDASSFLASGIREMNPEELALRSTQLRVAFGVSGATFLTSVGVATNFIVKLARKHLAAMESDEEDNDEECESDGDKNHEAGLAGQTFAALRPDRPKISIHNQITANKIVEEPIEKSMDQTPNHPEESNEAVLAYY